MVIVVVGLLLIVFRIVVLGIDFLNMLISFSSFVFMVFWFFLG